MRQKKTLSVYCKGDALVLDYDFAIGSGGHRRYIGRHTLASWNLDDFPEGVPYHEQSNEFLTLSDRAIPHTAYPPTGKPATVLNTSYVRKTVQKGMLWPADLETAKACGVEFDPLFGGEYLPNE